ncbi:MAG: pyridoxal phosphate-dependent aminotransferase, partial [Pygmaiobacter sp.]
MNSIKDKMRPVFRGLQGGLFAEVGKADVGNAFSQLQKNGVSMMSWADPFYPDPSIPEHVKAAAIKSIEGGKSAHYTMPTGDMELKEKIAEKLRSENHMELDAQRNILITPGSDSGLFYSMMPFLEPGDEVLMLDPSYPSNFLNAELLGAVPVGVPLYAENDFRLDITEFEQRLTPKTKMVLLTNPNNPTTTVFGREELEGLAKFIVKHDLVCVCDEAFESIIFDGREFVDIATLPGMWERTLTTYSISKGMGLSGFRVACIVADDHVIDALFGATVNVLGATSTVSQQAAIAAYSDRAFVA